MWVAMMAFWGLLASAIFALVTGVKGRAADSGRGGQQPGDAHRILDERLARGEIDVEEYRRCTRCSTATPAGTGSRR